MFGHLFLHCRNNKDLVKIAQYLQCVQLIEMQ